MPMAWSSLCYQNGSSYLRQNFTFLCVCSTRPTTLPMARGTSSTGISLAVSSSAAATDLTISTGDKPGGAGYKLTLTAFSNLTVHDTGQADHVALCGSSFVLYTATCTTVNLTTSDTVTVPAFDLMDIAGPTSS